MPIFQSAQVFFQEIDLSQTVPTAVGPLRPAFIITANKGPVNVPTFTANSAQALDTFGEPFPESYGMYAVLAYLEEGNACYIMRVGVACEEGQVDALADICIDQSGGRAGGWGRIPLFTGIDFGRILLREISSDAPYAFHGAAFENITFTDVELSTTDGATTATLDFGTSVYTGAIDDSYIMVIFSPPDLSEDSPISGADFQVIRNSDGFVVASGTLTDPGDMGFSQFIDCGNGVVFRVELTFGELDTNDTFTFTVRPNNRVLSIAVEGGTATEYSMPVATYTTVSSFITAFNLVVGSGEDYLGIAFTTDDDDEIPSIRTRTRGERIQIMTTQGWSLEVGIEQYTYDIPRSFLIGLDSGPYTITTQNSRVAMQVIDEINTELVEFNVPQGVSMTASVIAAAIDLAGVVAGDILFESFALIVPGAQSHVVIVASESHQLGKIKMLADFSHIKTLRFAEELDIQFPYTRNYRGFTDNRTTLPDAGQTTASVPLSCEVDPLSDECASDSAYYESIVGWLVATTPGTWLNTYTLTLDVFTEGVGNVAGRYKLTLRDRFGQIVDVVEDVSFDKNESRYIGNLVDQGSSLGGTNGNKFFNWEPRPSFLNYDPDDTSTYEVRQPSSFNGVNFEGGANGIPLDPVYSAELDSVLIGNPANSTGIYAFSNAETFDINLIAAPGFSSGPVIGQLLQLCENRGDCLAIIDPPFGLRPQQVVDWHNGMLLSDLQNSLNSSYGALYWGWLRTFDQFNSIDIWVPPSGHVTAVFSRTARVAEQWVPPAGTRRGRLLTALQVEYDPSLTERDLLQGSGNAVNPIVNFPQDGIVVFGQRTLQRTQSALSDVNVRMLVSYIKKSANRFLRQFIFELNDRIVWDQVKNVLNPFLADIQARRGINGFKVICDETNNTPERRDQRILSVAILIIPERAIEVVAVNLVILRQGASFSSEEVLAAAGIVTQANA